MFGFSRVLGGVAGPMALVVGFSMGLGCQSAPKAEEPSSAPAVEKAEKSKTAGAGGSAMAAPAAKTSGAESSDVFQTSKGPLKIVPLQHGTLRIEFDGKHIYVDPWSSAPLPEEPKADLILITDIHGDHLDPAAVKKVSKASTVVVGPQAVADKLPGTSVIANGETKSFAGFAMSAVAMYNHKRGPQPGKLYHDKGRGNGYVLSLGGKRLYLSGDTACTSEMKALENIDVALVSMNLPYTMPPEEAVPCVAAFKPKVVYPYHYRGSDLSVFQKALQAAPGIEVRLRQWYP